MYDDNNVGQLLNKLENAKFKSRPTKKVKKQIRKAIVLNELEKEKAKGIRNNISSVFAFLNSGEPKLPILRGDSDKDLDESLGQKFVRKLIELPISLVYLPFVAIKMGINAFKLRKWLKQKNDLFYNLKTQGLFDNIEQFTEEQKKYFKLDNPSKFIEHVLSDHKRFPNEYSGLIKGMTTEFKETVAHQEEIDRNYDRHL